MLNCCTQKKDLIESKKMICLNDFFWFKEMICINEIKFVWIKLIFLQIKEINALIYGQRYNLFYLRQKFIWFELIFIWSKDILLESNKFCFIKTKDFLTSKKMFQTNNFFDSIKSFFWVGF